VRDVTDGADLRRTLQEQAAGVSQELRRKRLTATTVKLKLRWSDFATITRQLTAPQPTDDAAQIYSAAARLLATAWQGEPVRLIGVGVSGLGALPRQLGLWDQPDEKEERLQAAIKNPQIHFGENVIQHADLLGLSEEE
jgi:DNA polymerase-4